MKSYKTTAWQLIKDKSFTSPDTLAHLGSMQAHLGGAKVDFLLGYVNNQKNGSFEN